MNTICNKCKKLWSRSGKYYCMSINNCKYSKNKKQCPYFEEGENVKKYIKQGWWRNK